MTKSDIATLTMENTAKMKALFTSNAPELWEKGLPNKWTTGQHVIHLIQSANAINKAIWLPGFVLKWQFGVANRASRTYNEVMDRYHEKLAAKQGVVAPVSRNMPVSLLSDKTNRLAELDKAYTKTVKYMLQFSDKQMDTLIVPHPLMGKMVMREFFMWNAGHIKHHIDIINAKYLV